MYANTLIFFMNLLHHLDLTLQQTLPSLSHFNELIDLNWIEACLKETGRHLSERENSLLNMWYGW